MLTLHMLSEEVKLILKWVGGIFGGIFFIFLLFKGGIFIKNTFFPTPPPPPTVSFGKLPKIAFPPSVSDNTFAFSVDTVTGSLPSFPDRLPVYKTITKESSLFDLERARDKVKSLGFSFNSYDIASESALSHTLYEWRNNNSLGKTVTMDIITNNFRLTSSYLTNDSVINPASFPAESDASHKVTQTLTSMGLLPLDVDTTKTRTELLQINNSALIPASSISSANIIRVDLFQKDRDTLPIVYPHPPYSTMNFLIGGTEYDGDILQASFTSQEVSKESATYPIKTATAAFDELQRGKAYIATYYGSEKAVPIKKIYLAYLVTDDAQDYLQPVVVFEGKDGFFAYLPAIVDNWYQ